MTMVASLTDRTGFYRVIGDGTEYVLADDVTSHPTPEALGQHVDMSTIVKVEHTMGYGARLVDDGGALDNTPWLVDDDAESVRKSLIELYDLCPVCMQALWEAWSENPACRIYHKEI